ncbi:hypothetical protein [Microbacterium sp.]|uniref:hypothetical protein n=1 Tax=Microbacterium sp. TaxID=51671 RepID=UPI003C28357B
MSSRGRRTDWRLGGRTVHPWRSQVLAVALLGVGLGMLLGTLVTVLVPSSGGLGATGVLWLGMLVPIVWAFARSRPAGLLRFRFSTCCGGSGSG